MHTRMDNIKSYCGSRLSIVAVHLSETNCFTNFSVATCKPRYWIVFSGEREQRIDVTVSN